MFTGFGPLHVLLLWPLIFYWPWCLFKLKAACFQGFLLKGSQICNSVTKLTVKDATDAKTHANSTSARPESHGRRPGPGFGKKSAKVFPQFILLTRAILGWAAEVVRLWNKCVFHNCPYYLGIEMALEAAGNAQPGTNTHRGLISNCGGFGKLMHFP